MYLNVTFLIVVKDLQQGFLLRGTTIFIGKKRNSYANSAINNLCFPSISKNINIFILIMTLSHAELMDAPSLLNKEENFHYIEELIMNLERNHIDFLTKK